MSGNLGLDWATLAVSLFNTIILLWLGLTVLLNAEQRRAGIWLAGLGLLAGALFFLSHSAILGLSAYYDLPRIHFWWQVGWIPVVLAPYAWYLLLLYYAGFWEDRASALYRRHWIWFTALSGSAVVILGLLVFANPLPSIFRLARYDLSAGLNLSGAPLLLALYPPYMLACVGLSLDALRRPGPTMRVMGRQARQRAQPWLLAACLALLLVSLLVTVFMLWLAWLARQPAGSTALSGLAVSLDWLAGADLVISSLIGLAITLTGQAIVAYEVFTGKSLPQRGLQRYWQRLLFLAAGYSALAGLSLAQGSPSIYAWLLSLGVLAGFFALFSQRAYQEQQLFLGRLRSFFSSRWGENSLLPGNEQAGEQPAFTALCQEILRARSAFLAPCSVAIPLFGAPLAYPGGRSFVELPANLPDQFTSPQLLCLPGETFADLHETETIQWVIPLWTERGLSGVLLLGPKQDGGLYVQEEIELARVAGERLISLQINAELTRRLALIQRQRLAESRVADQRTRRRLHDDILPQLHTALLTLSAGETPAPPALQSSQELLVEVHRQISSLLYDMPTVAAPELQRHDLFTALRQVLDIEFHHDFETIDWQVSPEASLQAQRLPPFAAEVLFYATREVIRNASRHGRGHTAPSAAPGQRLNLQVTGEWREGLMITIQDDGVGLASRERPTPADAGHGLALHSTLLAIIGGTLSLESQRGTRAQLWLPLGSLESLLAESQSPAASITV